MGNLHFANRKQIIFYAWHANSRMPSKRPKHDSTAPIRINLFAHASSRRRTAAVKDTRRIERNRFSSALLSKSRDLKPLALARGNSEKSMNFYSRHSYCCYYTIHPPPRRRHRCHPPFSSSSWPPRRYWSPASLSAVSASGLLKDV